MDLLAAGAIWLSGFVVGILFWSHHMNGHMRELMRDHRRIMEALREQMQQSDDKPPPDSDDPAGWWKDER